MPILPKAISKKLLNATEKVKNYVESWDLDEDHKPNPPLNSFLTSTTKSSEIKFSESSENQLNDLIPPTNVCIAPQTSNYSTSFNSVTSDLTCSTNKPLSNAPRKNSTPQNLDKQVSDETKYITHLVQNINPFLNTLSSEVLKPPSLTDVSSSLNNDNSFFNSNRHISINETTDKLHISDDCTFNIQKKVSSHNPLLSESFPTSLSKQSINISMLTETPNSCSSTTSNSMFLCSSLNSCNSVWSYSTPITSVASTPNLQQPYFQNNTFNSNVQQFEISSTIEKLDNQQQSSILDSNIPCFVSQSNNLNNFEKTKESKVSDRLSNSDEIPNIHSNSIVNDIPSNASIVNLNAEASATSNVLQPNSLTQLDVNNFNPGNISNHIENCKFPTRHWCIFCKNYDHLSHSCIKFRSKEQYWEQILAERRCKNCLRFYHKSTNCYDHSFCKNINCYRKDKHSPVLCESNYFYFDNSQSITHPCHNFFSQITNRKPPPLMSLDLSHIHNNLRNRVHGHRGKPRKVERSGSILVSKTYNDVSTQTSEDLIAPEKSVLYKSQSCQTDNLKEDISFFHQCSSSVTVLDSKQEAKFSTPIKSIVETDETPAESVLSTCNLDRILFLNKPQSQSTSTQPPKEKVRKSNENPSIVLPSVSMSFSEIISCKGPSTGTTKTINGFEIDLPPPVWENTSYPEHMRALEFLRHKSLQSETINKSDLEVIASAIKCLKQFIEKAEPKTALLYMSQLKCTLKSLQIENIKF